MKIKLSLLTTLLFSLCFTGCSDDDEVYYDGDLIGKWQLVQFEEGGYEGLQSTDKGTIVEYFSNGKYSHQYPGENEIFYGDYYIEDNKLCTGNDKINYVYDFSFQGDKLILELFSSKGNFCGVGVLYKGIYKRIK